MVEAGASLGHNTDAAVLRYLADQPPAEAAAAAEILAAEVADGGHAVLRHGPHITDAQLAERLRTGVTPDGVQTRGHWASTRFRSFRVMARSRKMALDVLRTRRTVDLRYPPGVNGNSHRLNHVIVIEVGKPVSRGVLGRGEGLVVPLENGPTPGYRSWPQLTSADQAVTRIQLKVSFEGGRWRVVQHFPGTATYERSIGRYTSRASLDLRRSK